MFNEIRERGSAPKLVVTRWRNAQRAVRTAMRLTVAEREFSKIFISAKKAGMQILFHTKSRNL